MRVIGIVAGDCQISNSGSYLHVDCSNRGLTIVPQYLPLTTGRLNLSYNNISHLGASSFKYLRKLIVLNITNARVQNLSELAFDGLYDLEELCLVLNPWRRTMPLKILHSCPKTETVKYNVWISSTSRYETSAWTWPSRVFGPWLQTRQSTWTYQVTEPPPDHLCTLLW